MIPCGVNEVVRLERKLARIERLEAPVALASGLALAVPYLLWQYVLDGTVTIATHAWIILFAVGCGVSYFGFAVWGARVDLARRQLLDPGAPRKLPRARRLVRSRATPRIAPVARAPVALREPDLPPPDPAEGPRLLK
jgi:hypothetical protein